MSKVYSWRKLNEKELTRVYLDEMRRDFPPTELKPLSMILNSEANGTAHTWGVFDGETLAAYLLMVRPAGSRVSQLDYFAVLPEYRSAGLGAQLLALAGLVLVGVGCAPIYPIIIHATPDHFGADRLQAVIGIQMASAYVGNLVMPPLFGLLANNITPALFPFYLLVLLVLMVVMHEQLVRKTSH